MDHSGDSIKESQRKTERYWGFLGRFPKPPMRFPELLYHSWRLGKSQKKMSGEKNNIALAQTRMRKQPLNRSKLLRPRLIGRSIKIRSQEYDHPSVGSENLNGRKNLGRQSQVC